jgi:enamine deaminase RidA (YjgF/YER057c/UK114 family)
MEPIRVNAPSIYSNPPGAAHAVRFDDTVYTGAILPKDQAGKVVGKHDVVAQAKSIFDNLGAVLASAGANMGEVARVNCYIDPIACRDLERAYAIRDQYLERGAQAGTTVPLTLSEAGVLIAIEAIAHVGAAKQVVTAAPGGRLTSEWADAVRASDRLYVSGQYGRGATFSEQAKSIYGAFDAVVKAAGVSWRDVVRVHQFGIRPDLSIDEVRAARAPYLRNEEFLSTSVVCHAAELSGIPSSWQFIVDIEAALAPKSYSSTPGTWANPGGLHIAKAGNVGYFQAQMSRDSHGKTLYPEDAAAHTDQCCRNLDAMMKTANIRWPDVVHARVFCKRQEDVPVARRVVDRWLGGNACARAELVANFFDPLATIEIELTASV